MNEARHPLYRQARFSIAAHHLRQLPADQGVEVAFAGRSNAGKSSAINALTGQKAPARTTKTPGRTRQIVFFTLDEQRRLVDLPGYGYAKVPARMQRHWQGLMQAYFDCRRSLRGLVLVMDIRHPLKEFDQMMLDWCEASGTPVHILLTKADKLSRGAAAAQRQQVERALAGRAACDIQTFSALKHSGVEQALARLDEWLGLQ